MRAIWKGTISFGLVSIPIKLMAAIQMETPGFKMICKKCKTPVHYKRFCEGCKEELQMSDIAKGLEVSRGEYVIFDEDELKALKPVKSDRVDIKEFIDIEQVDPIYYDKPYFCVPDKGGARAYYLLKEVLDSTGKIGIGTFVMRDKEHVCAIRPYENGMVLNTLYYEYEVRSLKDVAELKGKPQLKEAELDLAKELVDHLYSKDFKIENYKDTFAKDLKDLLTKKGKVHIEEEEEIPSYIAEQPLLEQLKASFGERPKEPARKARAHKRPAKKHTKKKV